MKITFEELFGPNGIVPLSMYMGVGHAICPHCDKIVRGISFPPPGVIIVHSCPICGELVLPFLKKLVAIKKTALDSKVARRYLTDCLFNTIAPILMRFVDRLTSEKTIKEFLNSCWDIVYLLVGEKDDSTTFLDKLKRSAIEHKDDSLGREFEAYFEQMSQMFEKVLTNPMRQKRATKFIQEEVIPISKDDIINIKIDLHDIENVEDFLKKFGDSSK